MRIQPQHGWYTQCKSLYGSATYFDEDFNIVFVTSITPSLCEKLVKHTCTKYMGEVYECIKEFPDKHTSRQGLHFEELMCGECQLQNPGVITFFRDAFSVNTFDDSDLMKLNTAYDELLADLDSLPIIEEEAKSLDICKETKVVNNSVEMIQMLDLIEYELFGKVNWAVNKQTNKDTPLELFSMSDKYEINEYISSITTVD
jgi:hypothetical protein